MPLSWYPQPCHPLWPENALDAAIPVVLFNRDVPESPASSVTSDNVAGGRRVADYLIDSGHRRLAYIAGAENSSTNRDREAGFLQGIQSRGLKLHQREVGAYSHHGAAQATLALMRSKLPPDAIFVANDHMAFAVLDTLRLTLNLRVPEDVSVIGFDNVPQTAWGAYALTTVAQPTDLMIEATVSVLLDS